MFIKDLVIVDPEDGVPVAKVVEYFKHPLLCVSKEMGLLTLLDKFMEGHSHMCVVLNLPLGTLQALSAGTNITAGESHQSFEHDYSHADEAFANPVTTHGAQMGIVTLEDLFEEMLTLEIHDEHDVYLLEHRDAEGHDAAVEKVINERSKAHIHEVPPRWLAHFGMTHEEMSDEEYRANFVRSSLEELAETAGATEGGYMSGKIEESLPSALATSK